jgi:hypothetical protein
MQINLDVLRRLDQFREWHSLDDKRFCLVCGKIISGRRIQIAGWNAGKWTVTIELSNGAM